MRLGAKAMKALSMDVSLIDRPAGAFQENVPLDQLLAICGRAFGPGCVVTAIAELAGGSINNVYRVECAGRPASILRVAPRANHDQLFWHEQELLRREFMVQPFLAPIATRIPALLMADFTHELIDRDYLLQSYIPGQLWQALAPELAAPEQAALWRELGTIARTIHNVRGPAFGVPAPAQLFLRWSDAVLADFDGITHDLARWGIPAGELQAVAAHVRAQPAAFDKISQAHLLHGDLWLNNLLIQQTASGPVIAGVIDAGFALWGDPAADWTIMRLTIAPAPEAQPFWETYGPLERDSAASMRALVYQARSIGYSLLELKRMRHAETDWLWAKLREIIQALGLGTRKESIIPL